MTKESELQPRFRLSELIPPDVKGLIRRDDPELPTVEEIRTGTFQVSEWDIIPTLKTPYIKNPAFLGRENLEQFYLYWSEESGKLKAEIAQLESLDAAVTNLVADLAASKVAEKRLSAVLAYLDELIGLAEKKPPIPVCREFKHFQPGDKVLCYITDHAKVAREYQFRFMMGVVEDNNKLRKGMPLVRFPECVLTYTASEITLYGHGVDYYTRTMNILHPEEYRYLLDHPDYWEIWAWAARSSKSWCRWVEEMYQHFGDAATIVGAG